jgi:hypothetical protein
MNRFPVVIFALMMVVIYGASFEFSQAQESEDTMCVPMGSFTIEPPESIEAKRSPVEFPHSRHFTIDCKKCHHKWPGDAKIQSCSASECHDLDTSPKKAQESAEEELLPIRYYKAAFHKQCIGCHKASKLRNLELEASGKVLKEKLPNTGPTGCVECHPKEG